jgi:hypothetical protein
MSYVAAPAVPSMINPLVLSLTEDLIIEEHQKP